MLNNTFNLKLKFRENKNYQEKRTANWYMRHLSLA